MSKKAQVVSVDELREILNRHHENPRIVLSGNLATPEIAVTLVDEVFATATLNMLNAVRELPIRNGLTLETAFVGPAMRDKPTLRYAPCRLSMVPVLFRTEMVPDIVMVHTSTPRDGKVSLGIEVNVLPGAIEAARNNNGLVIAFVNPNMPYTYGDSEIELDSFDYLVEIDEPLMELPKHKQDSVTKRIGKRIAKRIGDGATLQLGIGAIPDAVLSQVKARGLRIWTETFSDGVLELERKKVLDQNHQIHSSFLIGSHDLYEWADQNPRITMLRTETTNNPSRISKNPAMTSINAALQFDLHGQANASRLRGRIFSGFGGSTDFIVGAIHSKGGRAYMALPSWRTKANVSTIVPQLDVPATSFQQNAVVTEQGMAWLFGYDEREQAHHIINKAAHPDARDELREAAAKFHVA